jgi:hypothetical protein
VKRAGGLEQAYAGKRTGAGKPGLLLCCVALALACAAPKEDPEQAARALYRAAWEKKTAGDPVGGRRLLQDLSARYPQTRAGKHATRVLAPPQSSDDVPTSVGALFGATAGVMIPALISEAYGGNAMVKETFNRKRRHR